VDTWASDCTHQLVLTCSSRQLAYNSLQLTHTSHTANDSQGEHLRPKSTHNSLQGLYFVLESVHNCNHNIASISTHTFPKCSIINHSNLFLGTKFSIPRLHVMYAIPTSNMQMVDTLPTFNWTSWKHWTIACSIILCNEHFFAFYLVF